MIFPPTYPFKLPQVMSPLRALSLKGVLCRLFFAVQPSPPSRFASRTSLVFVFPHPISCFLLQPFPPLLPSSLHTLFVYAARAV
jgi:hypothetical protein